LENILGDEIISLFEETVWKDRGGYMAFEKDALIGKQLLSPAQFWIYYLAIYPSLLYSIL